MGVSQKITFSKRLLAIVDLNIRLVNKTGLLIQMPISAQSYRIGGADKYPMTTRKKYYVKNIVTEIEVPYIPGSSLRGRIRSLLELSLGKSLYTTDGKIWSHVRSLTSMDFKDFESDVKNRDVIDELFGWASANYQQILDAAKSKYQSNAEQVANQLFELLAPTRLLISDLFPPEDYVANHNIESIADFLEEKPENRIDRVTSAADPREVVRVRPGVEFSGTMTILLFNIDADKINEYVDTVLMGLKLVEETYLGGSGSRGYGRVKIIGDNAVVYKLNPPGSGKLLEEILRVDFKSLEDLDSKKRTLIDMLKKLF